MQSHGRGRGHEHMLSPIWALLGVLLGGRAPAGPGFRAILCGLYVGHEHGVWQAIDSTVETIVDGHADTGLICSRSVGMWC